MTNEEIIDEILQEGTGDVAYSAAVSFTRSVLDATLAAGFVVQSRVSGCLLREAPAMAALPAPRLQLRWLDKETCNYELVLPVHEFDIRIPNENEKTGFIAVPLGGARVRGGNETRLFEGKVEEPYRDGARIRWDGKALGLRMFAIHWEGVWTELFERTAR